MGHMQKHAQRVQGHAECVHFEYHGKALPFQAEEEHSVLYAGWSLIAGTGLAHRYDGPCEHRPALRDDGSVHHLHRAPTVFGGTRMLASPYYVRWPTLPHVLGASSAYDVSDLVSSPSNPHIDLQEDNHH